jgi:hypothetical protein
MDGLIFMSLLGKTAATGHSLASAGYGDAQGLAEERYRMSEWMERRAQLWLGELLKEPRMMEALKGYVFKKRPGASVGEKFEDIRQEALLGTWKRISRAIVQGGESQPGSEQDSNYLNVENSPDVDRVLLDALSANDKGKFQRMAKTLIYNQIGYRGADLTRIETQKTVPTVALAPEMVGASTSRRNETSAPIDYSEPDNRSAHKVEPQICPDLSYPDTREDVEERENVQSAGQQLKESWLNWLRGIHESKIKASHKHRLEACIEFEHLAFIDDGKVEINLRIGRPGNDDPYLYHAILGRTHGVRRELAEKYNISLRSFESELQKMREEYWPAWVASIIGEKK